MSKLKEFSLIIFIGYLININTSFLHFDNFKIENKINIYYFIDIINFLRAIYPSVILFSIILILVFYIKNLRIFFSKLKNNHILIFFFIFFFSELISLFNNQGLNFGAERIYFNINSISFLLFITILNCYHSDNKINFLLNKLIIFFISFVLTILLLPIIFEYLYNLNSNFYDSYYVSYHKRYFEMPAPRITGLARMLVIINIIFLTLCFYRKNFIYFLILFFLSLLIWLAQARGAYYSFLIIIFSFMLLASQISIKKRIVIILVTIIIPIICTQFFNQYKINSFKQNSFLDASNITDEILKEKFNDCLKIKCSEEYLKKLYAQNEFLKKQSINTDFRLANIGVASGRFEDWKKIFKKLNENKILIFTGLGPQSDRYLINETASNAYILSLLNAGIIGLFSILVIVFYNIKKVMKLIFIDKIFLSNKQIFLKILIIINLFIILRGLYEASFVVYGVDFMIFVTTSMVINKHQTFIQKNNKN